MNPGKAGVVEQMLVRNPVTEWLLTSQFDIRDAEKHSLRAER